MIVALRPTPLCPAGHLPLKGGDHAPHFPRQDGSRLSRSTTRLISPLEGEMPGRAEGGGTEHYVSELDCGLSSEAHP
jgi:hypothetical protein